MDVGGEASLNKETRRITPRPGVVRERPFGPRFVTPMFLGSALNPVNSSVIATALVSIAAAMGVSTTPSHIGAE